MSVSLVTLVLEAVGACPPTAAAGCDADEAAGCGGGRLMVGLALGVNSDSCLAWPCGWGVTVVPLPAPDLGVDDVVPMFDYEVNALQAIGIT